MMNYLSNLEVLTDNNIGDISDRYLTLITPAAYAFSIWGVIFLGLAAFVGFQWYQFWKNDSHPEYEAAGYIFAVSCILNGLWTIIFLKEWILLSVLVMLGLLICLIKLVKIYRIAVADVAARKILFQWWPISLYLGWIILAMVINVSAYLVSLQFEGGPFSTTTWAIIVLFLASSIYSYLSTSRNIALAGIAGLWGFYGIITAQRGLNETVVMATWIVFAIVAVVLVSEGIKNWHSSFISKLSRGEW